MYRTEILLEKFEFGAKPQNTQNSADTQEPAQNNQKVVQKDEDVNYPDENINPEDIPF
jgi:hypothetical protein